MSLGHRKYLIDSQSAPSWVENAYLQAHHLSAVTYPTALPCPEWNGHEVKGYYDDSCYIDWGKITGIWIRHRYPFRTGSRIFEILPNFNTKTWKLQSA